MKLDPYLTPHRKVDSKWFQDLNIKTQNSLLGENTGEKLHDTGLATKAKIDKYLYIKQKSFCRTKTRI